MLRFAAPSLPADFAVTLALASALALALGTSSCAPYQSPGGGRPLLVDREAPRYGRVIAHAGGRTLPIVRGDGIAELFVEVQIGTTRGWWQIDTGAAYCVVSPRIGRREGFVPLADGEIITAAGAVSSQLGTVPSVRLADLEIRDVTVLSLADNYLNEFRVAGQRGRVIGILGADLLDFLDASLDLRANLLRFRTP